MPIQEIPHAGWSRNLLLANDYAELIITLEVGPRILSYRPPGGKNIFHNYPSHLGQAGETEWMNRGGHRLWTAPEDKYSYLPDNEAFPYQIEGESSVRLTTPASEGSRGIRKDLVVALAAGSSEVALTHTLTNESPRPVIVAPWALSVMAPHGIAFLPQPELGRHPRDLLPDRALILWPYADATDPRFHLGRHFISLRQEESRSAFKFGLAHRGKWAAYLLGDQLFIKTVAHLADATYPDFGCNYESYTDGDMLEIETLGPLTSLAPGASIHHLENWCIHGTLQPPPYSDTAAFADWLAPYLQ